MTKVSPILIYKGQASQAIELYKKAFAAEIKVKMLYSDANPKDFQCKDEEKDFIYHAQIKVGNQVLMLADDSGNAMQGGEKSGGSFLIDLVVEFDSDDELKAAYEVLSDGATIIEPLNSPSFCSLCVILIDKFGGRWQLMSGYVD